MMEFGVQHGVFLDTEEKIRRKVCGHGWSVLQWDALRCTAVGRAQHDKAPAACFSGLTLYSVRPDEVVSVTPVTLVVTWW